jgi:hypothetical protein
LVLYALFRDLFLLPRRNDDVVVVTEVRLLAGSENTSVVKPIGLPLT